MCGWVHNNLFALPHYFSKLLCEHGVLLQPKRDGILPEVLRDDVSGCLRILVCKVCSLFMLEIQFALEPKILNSRDEIVWIHSPHTISVIIVQLIDSNILSLQFYPPLYDSWPHQDSLGQVL